MSKITALIVTHNRIDKLKKTLLEIGNINFLSIVIVNCGSTDETDLWLNRNQKENWFVLNIDNIGGCGGFKYGCKYIVNNLYSDWVLLFDDDAYPEKNILDVFNNLNLDGIGLVGSKVKSISDDSYPIMNRLVYKSPNSIYDYISYIFNREKFLCPLDKECYAEIGSFVGLFIRFDILNERLELMEDDLFVYYDDAIFTKKCTNLNEKYLYSPALLFNHDIPREQIFTPWKVYLLARNQFRYTRVFPKKAYILLVLRTFSLFIKALKSKNKKKSIKALFVGLYHGVNDDYKLTISGACELFEKF